MSFSAYSSGGKENTIIKIPEEGSSGSANATPETDVAGASGTLYAIIVDCTDNPNEDVTCRLYDASSAPTVGTDDAEVWVPGKRGEKVEYEWPVGIPFGTGFSVATVKGKGGTGGSANPSGTVKITLRLSI